MLVRSSLIVACLVVCCSAYGQESVQVHGLLQLRVVGIVDTNIHEGFVRNSFYIRRGEIAVSSAFLEKKLRWEIRIDPIALTGKIVQDAYGEYSFSDAANVKLGQFKYPQSLEGLWSSAKLDFIHRSLLGQTYGDKRDIGVQLGGITSILDYAVGIFNGSGRNMVDNNSQKDVAGRVTFHAAEGLNVGGSFYEGMFQYAAPLAHNGKLVRFGGDLRFEWHGWTIQGEYMAGKDDAIKSRGWYAQASCLLADVKPGLRVEQFTPDIHGTNNRTTVLTLGVAYILDQTVSLALNALLVDDKRPATNANQLVAQGQVTF